MPDRWPERCRLRRSTRTFGRAAFAVAFAAHNAGIWPRPPLLSSVSAGPPLLLGRGVGQISGPVKRSSNMRCSAVAQSWRARLTQRAPVQTVDLGPSEAGAGRRGATRASCGRMSRIRAFWSSRRVHVPCLRQTSGQHGSTPAYAWSALWGQCGDRRAQNGVDVTRATAPAGGDKRQGRCRRPACLFWVEAEVGHSAVRSHSRESWTDHNNNNININNNNNNNINNNDLSPRPLPTYPNARIHIPAVFVATIVRWWSAIGSDIGGAALLLTPCRNTQASLRCR